MIPLELTEVATATDGRTDGDGGTAVHAVSTDTRTLAADQQALFVALRGEHSDGHGYLAAAAEAGASAALVERDDALPDGLPGVVVNDTWAAIGQLGGLVRDRVDPAVVAITGSVGKTTTKDLTGAALAADRPTTAAEGSFNNELGVPLTLLATTLDTQALVVEIGARGVGHIASLTPIVRPDVAIVTAVAGAHLEQFGDLATVARAKGELVEALTADGTAVLNADDRLVHAMAGRTDGRVVTYGVRATEADVTARDVTLDELGRPTFDCVTPWGTARCVLPVSGAHNVGNALAAIAAAGALGVPVEVASAGLAKARVSSWRGAVDRTADGVVVCNDAYNSNPTSALAALDLLARLPGEDGRAIAVLGVMAELGETADAGHREVGSRAAEVAQVVVAVGDTAPLADAAAAGGAEVHRVDDAAAALDAVRGMVRSGDAVLVKGSRVAGLETVADGLLATRVDGSEGDQ